MRWECVAPCSCSGAGAPNCWVVLYPTYANAPRNDNTPAQRRCVFRHGGRCFVGVDEIPAEAGSFYSCT
jgi:hypothetical protein